MTRIGLLQCDALDPPVASVAGDYPELIGRVVSADADTSSNTGLDVEMTTYRADLGRLPSSPHECAGWLVSGSRRSVYEQLPWMLHLGAFVDDIVDARAPIVGLCFGHQLIASRLGAPVEHVGWRLGVQRYRLQDADRADTDPGTLDLIAVHQDQVTDVPDGTELLATSPSCPVAGLRVDEWLLTMQPHPEFTPAVTRAIVASDPGRFGPARADRAMESLRAEPDNDLAATMIRTVLVRA